MITRYRSVGERVFDMFNTLLILLLMCVTLYPIYFVLVASFSDARMIAAHEGPLFWILGRPNLEGYVITFRNPGIITGFVNTVLYVVFGTALNLALTSLGAFVLTRKHFLPRNVMMKLLTVTMFFSGGIIPLFLVVKWVGIFNTPLAVLLPGAVSTYNLIIMRTFFVGIPESLEESAVLDGANDFVVFTSIILPLSKAVLAVLTLYYGVAHWNSWFNAMVFLHKRELFPLQLILREVLITNQDATIDGNADFLVQSLSRGLVKYCTIIVATVPILLVYPFLQKYFVKGVMIGAIKG